MGMVLGRIGEEMPRHSIVSTHAGYQIRRYEPSIAAMCNYSKGGWGQGSDGGPFGSLARYIGVFGKPENNKEPIAMTAPVLIDSASDTHTMMFLLPASKYDTAIDSAPKPTNPNVRVEMLPARLQAVRTFSGNLRAAAAREQLALLLADLHRDGWKPKDRRGGGIDWMTAGYNPPFTLPFLKTNEVRVTVEERNMESI